MTTTHVPPSSVTTGDAEIHYVDHGGPGEPILLIHAGVFSDWFTPLTEAQALGDLRAIRLIRAGYGHTPMPPPLTMSDQARHCAAVLEHLGLGSAHVLGHSSACAIAMQLAIDRPDVVRSLVLSEPPLIDALAAPQDRDWVNTSVGPLIGSAVAAAAEGDLPTAYATFMDTICGPDHASVITAALGHGASEATLRESAYFFADEIAAVGKWQVEPDTARTITAPTLLIAGANSPPPVHRLVAHLATVLPHCRIATFDGGDHLLPLHSPGALGALITTFVQSLAPYSRVGAPDAATLPGPAL